MKYSSKDISGMLGSIASDQQNQGNWSTSTTSPYNIGPSLCKEDYNYGNIFFCEDHYAEDL